MKENLLKSYSLGLAVLFTFTGTVCGCTTSTNPDVTFIEIEKPDENIPDTLETTEIPSDVAVESNEDTDDNNDTEIDFGSFKYPIEKSDLDGYIVYLADGVGEKMQKTYVYKTDDGRYRYVNVDSVTESWGSTKWKEYFVDSGTVDTKEEIVEVAKNHNSCGFAVLPIEVIDINDPDSMEREYPLITYEDMMNSYISVDEFLNGDF